MTTEVLTYLKEEGKFRGGDKYKDPETAGLIVPPYGREFTVVSRMDRKDFQGPIAEVFYVREARTKEPLLLKKSKESQFPLTNEALESFHEQVTSEGYEASKRSEDVDELVVYQRPGATGSFAIGIDSRDRKKPGIVNRLKGNDLEAKIIMKSWTRGKSPTAIYMGTEDMYTTGNVLAMINDPRFDFRVLQGASQVILNYARRHFPSTEELEQFLVLWGWR